MSQKIVVLHVSCSRCFLGYTTMYHINKTQFSLTLIEKCVSMAMPKYTTLKCTTSTETKSVSVVCRLKRTAKTEWWFLIYFNLLAFHYCLLLVVRSLFAMSLSPLSVSFPLYFSVALLSLHSWSSWYMVICNSPVFVFFGLCRCFGSRTHIPHMNEGRKKRDDCNNLILVVLEREKKTGQSKKSQHTIYDKHRIRFEATGIN